MLLCLWDFLGKNTGVSCRFLLQGIFLTQGSNPHLLRPLHRRWILYHGVMEGSPETEEAHGGYRMTVIYCLLKRT